MQQIAVQVFSFNKHANTLSEDASSLTGQFNILSAINCHPFEVVGYRETKRYILTYVKRERTRNEHGDIQAWEFSPINGHGRKADGPTLIIWND